MKKGKKGKWILPVLIVLGLASCHMIDVINEDTNSDWEDYSDSSDTPQVIYDYASVTGELTDLIDTYQPVGEGEYASCRLLVSADSVEAASGVGELALLTGPGDTYILQFDTPEAAQTAQQELLRSGAAYAEPDAQVSVQEVLSWGTVSIGADSFADKMLRYQTYVPVVAVVDSGVNVHSMLASSLLSGWDFVDNDSDPADEHGHGTHVAGIVADAMGVLQKGILPVRVLGSNGKGYTSQVGLGIRYAADQNADVINLSLGGGHSSYLEDAVSYARSRDCIVVAAAGNDTMDASDSCPAHIESCLTVSAVNANYELANFSNFGSVVDFCAPGVDIYSAGYLGDYVMKSGTSMAAPYVSACAAMIKACGLAETGQQTQDFLTTICMDLGEAGRDSLYGYGMPDMTKAMDAYAQKALLDNYWILGYESDAVLNLYEMVFYEDGTVTAVDMRDYAPTYGSYYTVGSQVYLTLDALELYEVQFYYEDPGFRTVDYFDFTGLRGTFTLTRSEGACFALVGTTQPEPVPEQTEEATPDTGPDPNWGPVTTLADGTYYILFYVDSFRGDETRTVVTADILAYVEIDDATAYSLQPGTAVQVGGYTLNVEKVEFSEIGGVRYLDINDWEYAQYLPEIGRWRFYTVNDRPLTYASACVNLLVPVSAEMWDYLTPYAYGENVYGQSFTGSESAGSSYFRLNRMDDYYFMHVNDFSEYAYLTVQNGTVVRVEIPYHP